MTDKISVTEAKELASTGAWASKKKSGKGQKYNNKVREAHGEKFDSELELFAYEMLVNYKIPFEFQYKHELQPSHVSWEGLTIKRINLFVDFRISLPDGTKIYFDTKGFETEESKIKYKILSYQLIQRGEKHMVIWKHDKQKVMSFIIGLKNDYFK